MGALKSFVCGNAADATGCKERSGKKTTVVKKIL